MSEYVFVPSETNYSRMIEFTVRANLAALAMTLLVDWTSGVAVGHLVFGTGRPVPSTVYYTTLGIIVLGSFANIKV